MGRVRGFESHLLSRSTFGWNRWIERDLLDRGWQAWLDRQLDPATIPDPEVDRLLAGYTTLGNSNWQNYRFLHDTDNGWDRLVLERCHATLLRALHSRRQLHEVMVEFWTNHFSVYLDDSPGIHLLTVDNREVARSHALGRFADLLQASAQSPAMLVYLDNHISNANSSQGVNENYGREVLELHTMGIVDGVQHYTEADVRGVSLVLSGWSVNTNEGQHVFQFKNWMHWTGPVSVLGGAFSTPGRANAAGLQDGVDLLDMLARHESTARHLAHKLCQRFVADDPPPALVESAASVYLANDTAIAPVLRHLFHSPEFAASVGGKVRRGFEILAAYGRALDGDASSDPMSDVSRHTHSAGWGMLDALGQRPWGRETPDGYPDTAPDWISADGLLRRWEIAGVLTATWLRGWSFDARAVLEPTGPTVDTWIEGVARRLLGVVSGYRAHGLTGVPRFAEDAVRWARAEGHTAGIRRRRFRGSDPMTRGELATVLWKIAGRPTGHPRHRLRDVPANLDAAVRWAVATGTIPARPNRRFLPDGRATRGLFAAATWTMANRPGGFGGHGLSDVPATLDGAVRWLVGCRWLNGYDDDTFRPRTPLTRAAATVALHRIHDETPSILTPEERAACLALFTDVPANGSSRVPQWLQNWKGHDLMTLMLSLPRFQHR